MRYIIFGILFSFFVTSCENKRADCKGSAYLKLNSSDSVCLNLYVDIDTNHIKEIVVKTQGKILLVFSGFTMPQKDILNVKNFSNPSIKELLQGITIIKLNVDNNLKRHGSDSSTIGDMNHTFQRKRFNSSTQPYHIFISNEIAVLGKPLGYTSDQKEVLAFLQQKFQ